MNITESDVIAFLRQRAEASGVKGLSLCANVGPGWHFPFTASVEEAAIQYGHGATIAEAIANLIPRIKTRAQVAAELRAEADRIEKGNTP